MALKHLLKKRLIFLFLLVAITSFIFNACRKYDVQKNVTDSALIERFFKVPENASPQLKAIIADVRKQNERYNFVTYFIDKNGWPRWQDAEIVSGQQFVANIPFVKEGQTEINGFFFVKMDTANSHAYYELYRKNLYEVYSKSDRIRSLNPYSMQMVINHLNQKLYGIDTFRFYDEREVPEELSNSYSSYVDWRNVVCKLKLLAKSNSSPSITAFLQLPAIQ